MPSHYTNDPEINEEIDETLARNLFRVDRAVRKLGYHGLTDEELRRAHQFAVQQTEEAIRASQPAPAPLPSVVPPGTPDYAIEGGLVNPRSNPQLREALRRRGM